MENHGFTEAWSWTDEYKRILALFERKLRDASVGDTAGAAAAAPAASR